MTPCAIYPGSFDPITNGHVDIIRRAAQLFDTLYVGVGVNSAKRYTFEENERVRMVQQACGEVGLSGITVHSFAGLVTDYARSIDATVIVRGLRTITDFEYEFQFAHVTRCLCPELEVVLLPTTEDNSFVSSSLVKELARHGSAERFVPKCVVPWLGRCGQYVTR
ncbi:MAG: pantetheine-phosphate adenylyltransferase [Dehalococcoidales bacterium]|nr:pantetheine-phosphate adenylyltransferase [Dehalococcoidales bacterium]